MKLKGIALSILMIFMTHTAFCQWPIVKQEGNQTRNFEDLQGREQGFWRIAIPDGFGHTSNTSEGFYFNGVPIGVWVKRTREGKIYQERIYFDTIKHKIREINYYLNGNLKSSGFLYSEPVRDSVMDFDPISNRDTLAYITRRLFQKGVWTFYHPNGVKESDGFYSKDLKVGSWKYYDDKGNLLKVEEY